MTLTIGEKKGSFINVFKKGMLKSNDTLILFGVLEGDTIIFPHELGATDA